MKKMNVGIVVYKFMGKAHSNAWKQAPLFFDMDVKPVLKVACGRHADSLKAFADRWGWEQTEADWKKMVHRDDVDIEGGLEPGSDSVGNQVRVAVHRLVDDHSAHDPHP